MRDRRFQWFSLVALSGVFFLAIFLPGLYHKFSVPLQALDVVQEDDSEASDLVQEDDSKLYSVFSEVDLPVDDHVVFHDLRSPPDQVVSPVSDFVAPPVQLPLSPDFRISGSMSFSSGRFIFLSHTSGWIVRLSASDCRLLGDPDQSDYECIYDGYRVTRFTGRVPGTYRRFIPRSGSPGGSLTFGPADVER